MNQPYVGQLLCVPYTNCPPNWLFCQGQILQIQEYDVLYAVVGNTFGGDGTNTFALPDLRGRVPLGTGQGPGLANYVLGQKAGVELQWLTVDQLPRHLHGFSCSSLPGTGGTPAGTVISSPSSGGLSFANAPDETFMSASMVTPTPAATEAFDNRQPFLVLNWIIATHGIFPQGVARDAK